MASITPTILAPAASSDLTASCKLAVFTFKVVSGFANCSGGAGGNSFSTTVTLGAQLTPELEHTNCKVN